MFNFERLDILFAWIGHPTEKLLPYDFLESFHFSISSVPIYYWPESDNRVKSYAVWICLALWCLILSVSIYYAPESDIRVKSYDHMNLPRASVVQISSVPIYYWHESGIRVKSYGCLNLPYALMVSFERLDILWAWIKHPSEKLWSYEFAESFRCAISSVSIYYWPESDIRVKSCGGLNLPCALMFNFKCLDILWGWIKHPSEKLWPYE